MERSILVGIFAVFAALCAGFDACGAVRHERPARAEELFRKLPLSFEPNRGQAEGRAPYVSQGRGYALHLSATEAVLALFEDAVAPRGVRRKAGTQPPASAPETVLRMKLAGANENAPIGPEDELPGKAHYFTGQTPDQWLTGLPTYGKVLAREVYPGIDIVYYGNQRQLEYDFRVAPGADPSAIRLVFSGAERAEIDPQTGDIVLSAAGREVRQREPVIYQEIAGERREIAGAYQRLGDGAFGFTIAAYDRDRALIIDPILSYSTFLPCYVSDQSGGLAVDSQGNIYVAGGNNKAFVAKINAAGTAFVYTAQIGGTTSSGDYATEIAVDSAGNAYVCGDAWSSDFPVLNAFQPRKNSIASNESDCFVLKLNASGGLVYSSYLGGGDRDDAYGVAVDPTGNAYVTGWTESPVAGGNGAPFPTRDAYQGAIAGDNDGFLTKVGPTGALIYSTYLGGLYEDLALDVAVDAAGAAYVTGVTDSPNFPTRNPMQAGPVNTNGDLFLTKFAPDGRSLVYSTYLGGSMEEIAWGMALDGANNVYLTGWTYSTDFPTANAFQPNGGSAVPDAFVTKVNAAGSGLVYSTYLGGNSGEVGNDIKVDGAGAAYIAGYTRSTDFPNAQAAQPTNSGGNDAFITKLTPQGALAWSTYWGGGVGGGIGADYGAAVAVDGAGNAYLLGQTHSDNFPLVNPLRSTPWSQPGAFFNSAFLVKLAPGAGPAFHHISGRVDDGLGNGVPEATITLGGAKAAVVRSSADGTYAFVGLQAGGSYTVSAAKSGFAFNPGSVSFANLAGDQVANFTNGPTTFGVSGRVTDASGAPISEVNINFTGSVNTSKYTAFDGTYALTHLAAGTNITVTPSHPSYSFKPASYTFSNMQANQTASFTATTSAPNTAPAVTLTSPNGGSTLYPPAAITVAGEASDTDGTIARVDFYVGATLLATDTSAPYEATWTPPQGGAYTFHSVATDDRGTTATSNSATIVYNTQQATTALSSVSVSPASVTGGATATGTVTLTAPAPSGGVIVALSSSNTGAASVPANVSIPAGASGASFSVLTKSVSGTVSLTITATYAGVSRTAPLSVSAAPADTITITRAIYYKSKRQIRVEATSTSPAAKLRAYVTYNGAFFGTLTNYGGGQYGGVFSLSAAPPKITVKSTLGGTASKVVTVTN